MEFSFEHGCYRLQASALVWLYLLLKQPLLCAWSNKRSPTQRISHFPHKRPFPFFISIIATSRSADEEAHRSQLVRGLAPKQSLKHPNPKGAAQILPESYEHDLTLDPKTGDPLRFVCHLPDDPGGWCWYHVSRTSNSNLTSPVQYPNPWLNEQWNRPLDTYWFPITSLTLLSSFFYLSAPI